MFKNNTKHIKILTPDGYKNFAGIQKLERESVSIHTLTKSLTCSYNHPVCVNFETQEYIKAGNINVAEQVYTKDGYESITSVKTLGVLEVYDIVGVEGDPCYFTNGILSHNCQFLSVGDSAINDALFYELSQKCVDPLVVLEDGNYKIYENPDSSRIYVAGVDISEGVGIDASVIQIFDITDPRHIKQVAVYHNRQIPPLEFTNKLYTILKNWGSPLALIERNNCGAQVVDRLAFDIGYEKVVSYGAKIAGRNRPQMGMIAHTNTKQKGVSNMRHFVNDMKVVEFRDIETLKEVKEFVRYPNGTWKAKGGFHDDRVMAAMYALFILDKEITERYLEILEVDDYGKPCSVAPMDFGVSLFENPTSIYTDFEVVGDNNTFMTPIVFGMGGSDVPAEMSMLEQEGWSILG